MAHNAGDLAERHGLRGFDAIHVASALWMKSTYARDLAFMGFDVRLTAAAAAAGLATAC